MLLNNLPSIQFQFKSGDIQPNMVMVPYNSTRSWIWPCFFDEHMSNVIKYLANGSRKGSGDRSVNDYISLPERIKNKFHFFFLNVSPLFSSELKVRTFCCKHLFFSNGSHEERLSPL
jgi:hypothetical protein